MTATLTVGRAGWWAGRVEGPRALAGRRQERQTVADILRGDQGIAALLVVGEAGIGKSRLVEVVAKAVQSDIVVLTGWCMPAAEGLPLLPMIDVLRSLGERDGGRLLDALAAGCPGFVRDEMARLLPEQPRTPEPAREVEPEAGRRRVFDAIRRMLSQWGARQPAAMIIEDVHWADGETCELLDYLFTPGRRTGVPIVLTCRTEHEAPEFATWLERWQRVEGVRRMDLTPLTEHDTTEQIAALLDQPVPRGFALDTYARSEGNPFFTEQLVAWAATASFRPNALATLPPGLTSLLLSRTRQIAGSTREILSALAVAKRPLTESDLVLLTGLSDAKARHALYELHALNLLRPSRGDGVELRHALLAEAVAADLLPAERRDQHGRIADLLIARNRAGDATDICEHQAAAGRKADELRWRVSAARDAERIFALNAASRHWQRAMALWDDVDDAESVAGLSFFEVYENTRDALSESGDDVGAGALTEAVFSRLGSSVTGDIAVRMFCALGDYRGFRSGGEALAAYATAIEVGRHLPPSEEYVRALQRYAQIVHGRGDYSTSDDLIERAVTAARAGGFQEQEKELLVVHGETLVDRGLFAPARDRLEQSMRVRLVGPPNITRATKTAVGYDYVLVGMNELRRAIRSSVPAIEIAERAGLGDALAVHMLRANVIESWTELGDVAEAVALVDPITDGRPTGGSAFIYMHRAHLDLLRGRTSDAEAFWVRDHTEVRWGDMLHQRWELLWRRAEFDLWLGRPDHALAAVRPLLEQMLDADMTPMTARLFALGAWAYADLAENDVTGRGSALADGDQLLELARHAKVDPFAGPMPVTAPADGLITRAERARAIGAPAPDLWAEAAASFEALERPHRAAYARWRQAEALLAMRGHQAEAAELLRNAARQAVQHVPLMNAIRDLARRARIDLSRPDDPTAVVAAASPDDVLPFGLTNRELAVLRLVADGKTNAEIGAVLYISPKTASVHVTNIMRRLHASSRVQAATIAGRAGLLDRPGKVPDRRSDHAPDSSRREADGV